MKVAFRVDSGNSMGGGHLSRCLTLANKLRENFKASCYFILRAHEGCQVELIKASGFVYKCLPLHHDIDYFNGSYEDWVGGSWLEDAEETEQQLLKWASISKFDWLIVDHYGLDAKWESVFHKQGIKIGVIDDLVNRSHVSDFLVDQTCGRSPEEYSPLLTRTTKLLTGEQYCILRPDFFEHRETSLALKQQFTHIKKVLINFGSTDPHNHTCKALLGIKSFANTHRAEIIVVVGSGCPHLSEIQAMVNQVSYNSRVMIDVQEVAKLLASIDLAVGAAGASTWERCMLGVPTLLVKTAENQSDVIQRVVSVGAAQEYLGNVASSSLSTALEALVKDYNEISSAAAQLVDGSGFETVIEQFKL